MPLNLLDPAMTVAAFNDQQMPIGAIIVYTGANPVPKGWLLCDGSSVSQATYAALYAVLGKHFGGTDPNFALPTIANIDSNARLRYIIKALRYDP